MWGYNSYFVTPTECLVSHASKAVQIKTVTTYGVQRAECGVKLRRARDQLIEYVLFIQPTSGQRKSASNCSGALGCVAFAASSFIIRLIQVNKCETYM